MAVEIGLEFEAFARVAWPRLVRAATLLGCDLHTAEDKAQTVLTSCYRRWSRIGRLADSPDAYAHIALVNEVRKGRHTGEVLVAEPPDGLSVDRSSRPSGAVIQALLGLPIEQREVIVCRFYLSLTDAESAQTLGIPLGTVKSRKSRALGALASNVALQQVDP